MNNPFHHPPCRSGLAATLFLLAVVSSALAAAKPNILLVLSDDHSYPFLSCYGDARTAVGDYTAPNPLKGKVENVKFLTD